MSGRAPQLRLEVWGLAMDQNTGKGKILQVGSLPTPNLKATTPNIEIASGSHLYPFKLVSYIFEYINVHFIISQIDIFHGSLDVFKVDFSPN